MPPPVEQAVMVAVTSVIAANPLMFAKWREIPMRVPSENKVCCE
ncbi:Unknown protein sequence [Pseudomonas savastanoi pv. glycinea]|nr:Unknown protein sequence [Pseudomonas savastanoi pv. glycinea]